jgi:hypothetical protein
MYSTAMCKGSVPVAGSLKPNVACLSIVPPHNSVKLVSFAADLSDVTCTSKVGSVTKDDPAWEDRGRLCGGVPSEGSCDNAGVCIPRLGEPERVCISRPGDNSCPGAYPERQLVYTAFEDSRDCSCTCTSSLNCDGQVQFGNPQSCNESVSYLAKAGDCWSPSTVYNWDRYLWPVSALQTTASAKPIGKLQAQDALTVCCLQ